MLNFAKHSWISVTCYMHPHAISIQRPKLRDESSARYVQWVSVAKVASTESNRTLFASAESVQDRCFKISHSTAGAMQPMAGPPGREQALPACKLCKDRQWNRLRCLASWAVAPNGSQSLQFNQFVIRTSCITLWNGETIQHIHPRETLYPWISMVSLLRELWS